MPDQTIREALTFDDVPSGTRAFRKSSPAHADTCTHLIGVAVELGHTLISAAMDSVTEADLGASPWPRPAAWG